MTEKQLRFIREYLKGGDEIAACRIAYPRLKAEEAVRAQAERLLASEEVQGYLRGSVPAESPGGGRVAGAQEVMEYLSAVMRGETESDGGARGPRSPDEKERLRAAELLGKHYNIFSDPSPRAGSLPRIIDDIADPTRRRSDSPADEPDGE